MKRPSRREIAMSRDAITEIELARQKKQIEQTLEEASWDIPRLLKINARLVKEKHEQAEQITNLQDEAEQIAEDLEDADEVIARLKELIEHFAEETSISHDWTKELQDEYNALKSNQSKFSG